jgi:hypothetical protein
MHASSTLYLCLSLGDTEDAIEILVGRGLGLVIGMVVSMRVVVIGSVTVLFKSS